MFQPFYNGHYQCMMILLNEAKQELIATTKLLLKQKFTWQIYTFIKQMYTEGSNSPYSLMDASLLIFPFNFVDSCQLHTD